MSTRSYGGEIQLSHDSFCALKPGEAAFLLLPDGKPPTQLSGNMQHIDGNRCPSSDLGDGRHAKLQFKDGKTRPWEEGFILVGREKVVSDLHLRSFHFSESTFKIPCQKAGYTVSTYEEKKSGIRFFTQETKKCDWNYYGLVQDSKCHILGKSIGDCPNIGPLQEGVYGKPQKIYVLEAGGTKETFIQVLASHWETHGPIIARLEKNKVIGATGVFLDSCSPD